MLEGEARARQLAQLKQNTVSQKFDQRVIEPTITGKAAARAAQYVGTNRQYVSDAKRIKEQAAPDRAQHRPKLRRVAQSRAELQG